MRSADEAAGDEVEDADHSGVRSQESDLRPEQPAQVHPETEREERRQGERGAAELSPGGPAEREAEQAVDH